MVTWDDLRVVIMYRLTGRFYSLLRNVFSSLLMPAVQPCSNPARLQCRLCLVIESLSCLRDRQDLLQMLEYRRQGHKNHCPLVFSGCQRDNLPELHISLEIGSCCPCA